MLYSCMSIHLLLGTNRNILPIFGNRKRQRQAIFADSIDIPISIDDSLFINDDLLDGKSFNSSTCPVGITGQQQWDSNASRPKNAVLPDENSTNYGCYTGTYTNNNIHPAEKTVKYGEGTSRYDSMAANNNTLNYGQDQNNIMPNNSFNISSQNKPTNRSNTKTNSFNFYNQNKPTNRSNTKTNSFSFPSQNKPINKNNTFSNSFNLSGQNKPINNNNTNMNSFNISNQKKTMNTNNINSTKSIVHGCPLGTLAPPNKHVKVSCKNMQQTGMMNR